MVPMVVYPIPDNISDGYSIWDRIYYGRLFIGSKNKLVHLYVKACEAQNGIIAGTKS